MGLLFYNDNGHSEEELRTLVAHDEVRALLGDVYFGTILQWKRSNWYGSSRGYDRAHMEWIPDATGHHEEAYYLTPQLWFSPTVMHPMTAPILFRAQNYIGRFDTLEVYNNCMEMQKFIDCKRCEHFGTTCVLINAPQTLPQVSVSKDRQLWFAEITRIQREELLRVHEVERYLTTIDDWSERRFRNWKSTIAGYTVIPAIATSDDATRPGVTSVRFPYSHEFGGMDVVRTSLSDRARHGVGTRATRRTQCPECYFGGRSGKITYTCEKYGPRACKHGKWTEEELVETTIQGMEPILKAGGYDLETFWRVSLVGGHQFKRERLLWCVRRMRTSADNMYKLPAESVFIELGRVARRERGEGLLIQSFDEVYKTLSDNLKERLDRCKEIDRRLLAIAIHASTPDVGKGYFCCRGGGFNWYQPNIAYVRIEPNYCVEIGLWGRTFERTMRFEASNGFERLASYFGVLPFFSRFDKEVSYHFRRWIR